MFDWDAFRQKVIAIAPEPLPPRRYWAIILRHDKSLRQSDFVAEDFLWVKFHSKVNVKSIYAAYKSQTSGDVPDVDLYFQGAIFPPSSAFAKDLNFSGDNHIFFQAVEKRNNRVPLQPVDRPTTNVPPPHQTPTPARSSPPKSSTPVLLTPTSASSTVPSKLSQLRSDQENCAPPVPQRNEAGAAREQFSHDSVAPHPHNRSSQPAREEAAPRSSLQAEPQPKIIPGQANNVPIGSITTGARLSRNHGSPVTSGPVKLETNKGLGSLAPAAPSLHHPNPSYDMCQGGMWNAQTHGTGNFVPQHHQDGIVKPEHGVEKTPRSRSPTPIPAFDTDAVFQRDIPEMESEARPTDVSIRKLIDQSSPEILEAGVATALTVLDSLKGFFSQKEHIADAKAWSSAINKLKLQAERKRTVVGVVGNTGAGKSSVINAMLDEERLVPTNCMRACTAVVTELSWNDSEDDMSRYRAEIEFISAADWEKELGILMKEFLSENGTLSRDVSDQNSDAGIAWAKFHAVYPKVTKDMLPQCTVEKLMSERPVMNVLGTKKRLRSPRPGPFYQDLQHYVDSKEKVTTGKKKEKGRGKSLSEIEYWPLIKVVKIFTKSAALSTGAVIVDLPGVHDSNAARAAVANNYMKQCTGLWIVAPINRAVDDKAAKTLLGESFKRQLKYDGGFSSITFICSKTDDISITEATDSLGINEEIDELDEQAHTREQSMKELKQKQADLIESRDVYNVAIRDADDEIEEWDELKDQLEKGEEVFLPEKKSKKRKPKKTSKKSRKRSRAAKDDTDDDFVVDDDVVELSDSSEESDADDDDDEEEVQALRIPLTEEGIKAKIDMLKEIKKEARLNRSNLAIELKNIAVQIKEAKTAVAEIRARMKAICIAGRNAYSKGAIQLDFAAGIRELDQENAAEENEEEFNPDEDLRDYDKVAESLPVFCVSSRGYQKLCGRLVKDGEISGFEDPEETEIPQLQAHCKKLTEAGRVQTCRNFLLNLCQQLNTFFFWAADTGAGVKLTDEEKRKQVKYLERRLSELRQGLDKAMELCIDTTKKHIKEQIFQRFPQFIEDAVVNAPTIAQGWGAHRTEGGLFYSTYKAIVRRDGAYTSASAGFRDFNGELVDPIMKQLATGWERAFQHRLPRAFETYTKDSGKILEKFHETIEERARENGVGLATISVLKNQLHTYSRLFNELGVSLVASMNDLQREANRDFTPTVVAAMHTAYQVCTDESGKGSYMRMKQAMVDHVDTARHSMFHKATETVTSHLKDMCRGLEEQMANKADEVFANMQKDYLTVLGGVPANQAVVMSQAEQTLRSEVKAFLLIVDPMFEKVANGEIEKIDANDNDEGIANEDQELETEGQLRNIPDDGDENDAFEPVQPANAEILTEDTDMPDNTEAISPHTHTSAHE